MSTLGPLDHIARSPLPWRQQPELTECGIPILELAGKIVTVVTVDARIKQLGRTRAAFTTCMTCAHTGQKWTGYDEDQNMLFALGREVNAVEHERPPSHPDIYAGNTQRIERDRSRWNRRQQLTAELRAITALVEAHREEFQGYMAGLAETVSLSARRRKQAIR